MRTVERCPSCFEALGSEPCECGYPASIGGHPDDLAVGTTLDSGHLVLGRVLGHGSFGTTYLAWDPMLRRKVVVKEFLPGALAGRDPSTGRASPFTLPQREVFEFAREQFRKEARVLGQFHHPNIVQVLGFLRDNGTDYLVTEHLSGLTLADYIQRHGPAPEESAILLIRIALTGLSEVHRQRNGMYYVHRNIKPSNVFLANVGQSIVPKLVDFGAARLAVGERSHNLAQVLAPGYAAPEQYRSWGVHGPWTDVYAVGATLCYALTGSDPPCAIDRLESVDVSDLAIRPRSVSQSLLDAIGLAMSIDPKSRPKDAASMLAALDSIA